MKIRTKFSIASGVVILITITILSITNIWLVTNTLEKKNESYVFDTASLMANQIGNWLAIKSSQIGLLKAAIEEDFSSDNFQTKLELNYLREEFILVFGTLSNETGLRSNDPNRKNPPGTDFRQRAWYKLGENSKAVVFTDPYKDAATNELLLSVVAPVYNNGSFGGVIGGDLSLDSIAKTVNSINFNNTGLAFLVNTRGDIITHPNAEHNNKNSSEIYGVSPGNKKSIRTIEYQGAEYLIYFHPINDLLGAEWFLAVLLDKDLVYQAVGKMSLRSILFSIISVAIAIFLLRKLVKHLLMPLNELEHAIVEIASGEGDLTQRLKVGGEDECGLVARGFNKFLKALQLLVKEIKTKGDSVVSQSGESKNLAVESGGQLSTQRQMVESLTTAMHEMSTTSADVAQSAQEAASYITDVNDKSSEGQRIFIDTSQSVQDLSLTIDNTLEHSDQLATYSNNIEQVLSVINGIAEQTNLLALNAAIEAARAGEQGRGFAVVADEVRTLASRTQDSTTEIKEMIEQIQISSNQVQQSLQKSKTDADHCVEQTQIARESLNEISESIKDIMDRNIQIATAAEEQSVVMEEINKNTHSINEISVQVGEFSDLQVNNNEGLVENVRLQQKMLEKFVV